MNVSEWYVLSIIATIIGVMGMVVGVITAKQKLFWSCTVFTYLMFILQYMIV